MSSELKAENEAIEREIEAIRTRKSERETNAMLKEHLTRLRRSHPEDAAAASAGAIVASRERGAMTRSTGRIQSGPTPAAALTPQAERAKLTQELAAAQAELARLQAHDDVKTALLAAISQEQERNPHALTEDEEQVCRAFGLSAEAYRTVGEPQASVSPWGSKTRAVATGPSATPQRSTSSAQNPGTVGLTDDEQAVCQLLGISAETYRTLGNAESISIDGRTVNYRDGSSVRRG